MPSPELNVLIGSGGRRNYIVRWFREAMRDQGVSGRIVVVDANPNAPALTEADEPIVVPRLSDPAYRESILEVASSFSIHVAFSLNDFELSTWSGPLAHDFAQLTVRLIGAPPEAQRALEDKRAYGHYFQSVGLETPRTLTGLEVLQEPELISEWGTELVIKHRFGSGSGGLMISSQDRVLADLRAQAMTVRGRDGGAVTDGDEQLDNLVVQEKVEGREYGIDVVNDLNRRFAGSLVRRKLSMRSGETDQAVSEDAAPFDHVARAVSDRVRHTGLIDADLITDGERHWLIDVNPRFGGGYPFSHLAGANVPACYIAWLVGRQHDGTWLVSSPGIASSKYEEISLSVRDRTTLAGG